MNEELASALQALHPDAFGWALHCCGGDRHVAEDVLQIAYQKWLQGRAIHSGRSSLKTWWFGVIRFTAREETRRTRNWEGLVLRLWNHSTADPLSAPAPSRLVELDEDSARLRATLAQLPSRQAEVLHLVFYQDLSLSATAAVLGISIGSARKHYERGKARLRALLTLPSPSGHDASR